MLAKITILSQSTTTSTKKYCIYLRYRLHYLFEHLLHYYGVVASLVATTVEKGYYRLVGYCLGQFREGRIGT